METLIATEHDNSHLDNRAVGVQVINLNKHFGDNHVLRDLNLTVLPGETLVILGRSGSGKSVLLKHMIGLMEPDSGMITIDGTDVMHPDLRKMHTLGMVFQSSALFSSLSVGENVALYLREHDLYNDEKIDRIVGDSLKIVGLEGKENEIPSQLSGGMKKRVAIARVLAMNPELILFDEPTAELDPMLTYSIGDEILNLRKQVEVTQVVVTHDVGLALYIADRIAVLDEGKIEEIGTCEEIKQSLNPLVKSFLSKFNISEDS